MRIACIHANVCVCVCVCVCVSERARERERETEFLYVGLWMYGKEKQKGHESSHVLIGTDLYPQLGCIHEAMYQELIFSYS